MTAEGTITVSGTGRVSVQPDTADVRLGVTISEARVADARRAAATAMAGILGAIEAAGVERRDVATRLLSLQPRYEYRDNEPPRLAGYELANQVEVRVRDLDRLAAVIDGALEAGATTMDSLNLGLADPSAAGHEARRMAMADARSRADVLASEAGLSIVGVISVVEDGPAQPPRPFAAQERMLMAADMSTPVESGSLDVVVRVSVTYRTEPRG